MYGRARGSRHNGRHCDRGTALWADRPIADNLIRAFCFMHGGHLCPRATARRSVARAQRWVACAANARPSIDYSCESEITGRIAEKPHRMLDSAGAPRESRG